MPSKGYKMTKLGELPEEWNVTTIEDACEILDSMRIPINSEEREKLKGNIPYYGANGVQDYINDYIFDDDLILLAEDGGYFEEYDARPIAYTISGKSWVNNHAHILKVKKHMEHYFVYYSIVHKNIIFYIKGGTRSKLNQSELKEIQIPCPPKKEQHRIAEILSTVDETIEHTESLIEKYGNIKKGLMTDLLTRGIDEEGKIRSEETHRFKDSPLGRIPEEWEVVEIHNCIEERKESSIPPHQKTKYVGLEHFKSGSLYLMGCDSSDSIKSNCSIFRKGDILYSKLRPYLDKVVLAQYDGICSTEVLVLNAKEVSFNEFLINHLHSNKFVHYATKNSYGTKMPRTSMKLISEYRISLPPLHEQHLIAKILMATDERLEKEEAYRDKILQIKKGLMQDLLIGRVRVKVPQEAVA